MLVAAMILGGVTPAVIGYWIYRRAQIHDDPLPVWTSLYIVGLFYGTFLISDYLLWHGGVLGLDFDAHTNFVPFKLMVTTNLLLELLGGLCGVLLYLQASDSPIPSWPTIEGAEVLEGDRKS